MDCIFYGNSADNITIKDIKIKDYEENNDGGADQHLVLSQYKLQWQ